MYLVAIDPLAERLGGAFLHGLFLFFILHNNPALAVLQRSCFLAL